MIHRQTEFKQSTHLTKCDGILYSLGQREDRKTTPAPRHLANQKLNTTTYHKTRTD